MAPRPTPTYLKLLTGNPGKRPIRADAIQPDRPSKPMAPPAHLDRFAKAEWKRMSMQLHRLGLLTALDRAAFEAYCVSYGVYRLANERLCELAKTDPSNMGAMVARTKNGNLIHNPIFSIRQKAMADMVKYATEFGFTPSARAQVQTSAATIVKKQANAPDSFFDD